MMHPLQYGKDASGQRNLAFGDSSLVRYDVSSFSLKLLANIMSQLFSRSLYVPHTWACVSSDKNCDCDPFPYERCHDDESDETDPRVNVLFLPTTRIFSMMLVAKLEISEERYETFDVRDPKSRKKACKLLLRAYSQHLDLDWTIPYSLMLSYSRIDLHNNRMKSALRYETVLSPKHLRQCIYKIKKSLHELSGQKRMGLILMATRLAAMMTDHRLVLKYFIRSTPSIFKDFMRMLLDVMVEYLDLISSKTRNVQK